MNTEFNEVKQAKDHLMRRVRNIADEHDRKLEKEFGLVRTPPKNMNEYIKWIKEDNFSIRKDVNMDIELPVYCLSEAIIWGSKPRDEKGYREALDFLHNSKHEVEDQIIVKTPAEGLTALRSFENWTLN